MAQYDPSCIVQFSMPGDATNIYCMIDARIVANVEAGLTGAQIAAVENYRWVPASADFAAGCPSWAGNDPVAVYFRTTPAKMQAALAKYYK